MNILKKFTQFEFEDEQRLVITVILISTIAIIGLLAFGLVETPANKIVLYFVIALFLVTLFLAFTGRLAPGRITVPATLWLATTFFVYTQGVRDVSSFSISAIIILAGILLAEQGALLFGTLSAVTVAVVALLEANGILIRDVALATSLSDNIIFAVLVFVVSLLQFFMVRRLTTSIKAAKEKELQQVEVNQELRVLQSELEHRVQFRTAQLRATNEVGQVASSILDPDELISRVVKLITETFGYYYAAIFLVVDNGRWAELKDATGSAGQVLKSRKHRLQVSKTSMVGATITTREPQVALDIGEAAIRFNNPLLPNTRSEAALPLMVGDRVIGALDVQSVKEADFKPEDLSTLQNMANQVAIAIENARLFRDMEQALEELQQTNKQYITAAWTERLQSGTLEYSIKSSNAQPGEESKDVEVGLSLRDQKIGQIRLQTEGEWTQEDQTWVESLATQVAISLENARLIEESQQSALRERLSASIIQKLWSSNSIDGILQTAVRELGRALEASEATIELKVNK